jgi:hypothetical protein
MTGKLLFGGTKTNGDGVAFRLGVNRTNIRQLLLANTAVNTANPIVRVSLGATSATSYIDARAMDGTTRPSFSIHGDAIMTHALSYTSQRKRSICQWCFAGDSFISSCWVLSPLLDSGGDSQPNHNNNGCSNDTGDSSLTINIKTTPTSTKHVT